MNPAWSYFQCYSCTFYLNFFYFYVFQFRNVSVPCVQEIVLMIWRKSKFAHLWCKFRCSQSRMVWNSDFYTQVGDGGWSEWIIKQNKKCTNSFISPVQICHTFTNLSLPFFIPLSWKFLGCLKMWMTLLISSEQSGLSCQEGKKKDERERNSFIVKGHFWDIFFGKHVRPQAPTVELILVMSHQGIFDIHWLRVAKKITNFTRRISICGYCSCGRFYNFVHRSRCVGDFRVKYWMSDKLCSRMYLTWSGKLTYFSVKEEIAKCSDGRRQQRHTNLPRSNDCVSEEFPVLALNEKFCIFHPVLKDVRFCYY